MDTRVHTGCGRSFLRRTMGPTRAAVQRNWSHFKSLLTPKTNNATSNFSVGYAHEDQRNSKKALTT